MSLLFYWFFLQESFGSFAFIDVLRNEFTGNNKLIWFLAVVFVPVIGPLTYFFLGRKQRIPKG